jgi:vacuole morphology and inheritance protein 14
MLLPQSSAFAALKNRLNSVSAIGYLHIAGVGPSSSAISLSSGGVGPTSRAYVPSVVPTIHSRQKANDSALSSNTHPNSSAPSASSLGLTSSSTPAVSPAVVGGFERPNRLKAREDAGGIRWNELLEKFRSTQERARRSQKGGLSGEDGSTAAGGGSSSVPPPVPEKEGRRLTSSPDEQRGAPAGASRANGQPGFGRAQSQTASHKAKSGLGNLGRFAGGVAGRRPKR